jgi:catechol 2,3-dioxygenase
MSALDRSFAEQLDRDDPLAHFRQGFYFADPEGNTVEIYIDMPFYISQPHGDPLDLDKDDETLLSETEEICRNDPSFQLIEDWRAEVFK